MTKRHYDAFAALWTAERIYEGKAGLIPGPNLCNLRLKLVSPCIVAGNSTPLIDVSISQDLDGLMRFVNIASVPDTGIGLLEFVDMGAYEFECNYTHGDVNCDGVVDFKDVVILCGNWLAGTEPEL